MKKIKIAFKDFPGPANPDAIVSFLKKYYDIEINDQAPDYLFYSVFGYDFFKYRDSIRIFFTGENVHADFNLCDYAFGFDWMEFGDRYHRCPNYMLYPEFSGVRDRIRTDVNEPEPLLNRSRFCNFIYSNATAHPFRETFYHRLSHYKKIDSAGIYLNNTGFIKGSPSLGLNATIDKISFQRECKFSIAMENSSSPGYTTEKLIHALAADTIPIYWGNPLVGKEFNTERFINCHDFDSVESVINRVIEIDKHPKLYLEILSKPFFANGVVPEFLCEDWLAKRFEMIFSIEKNAAYRRNFHVWGKEYEARRVQETRRRSMLERCATRLTKIFKILG